jgi:hypothetical protein
MVHAFECSARPGPEPRTPPGASSCGNANSHHAAASRGPERPGPLTMPAARRFECLAGHRPDPRNPHSPASSGNAYPASPSAAHTALAGSPMTDSADWTAGNGGRRCWRADPISLAGPPARFRLACCRRDVGGQTAPKVRLGVWSWPPGFQANVRTVPRRSTLSIDAGLLGHMKKR